MLLGVVFRRLLPYILATAMLVGAGVYIWWNGRDHGIAITTMKYEKAIQVERDRISKLNEQALTEAAQREQELNRLLRERDATIADLENAAASDPNANRASLSVDGVRRLNRVR